MAAAAANHGSRALLLPSTGAWTLQLPQPLATLMPYASPLPAGERFGEPPLLPVAGKCRALNVEEPVEPCGRASALSSIAGGSGPLCVPPCSERGDEDARACVGLQ